MIMPKKERMIEIQAVCMTLVMFYNYWIEYKLDYDFVARHMHDNMSMWFNSIDSILGWNFQILWMLIKILTEFKIEK